VINAAGAIGAVLCEPGFPQRISRDMVVMSRAVAAGRSDDNEGPI
jgi:hypothetical protein